MYHINSTSPYYLLNTADNLARKNYYNINSTPSSMCDGVLAPYPTSGYLMPAYNQRNAIDAPLEFELSVSVGTGIELTADITAESAFTGRNLKFRSALIAFELSLSGLNYEYVLIDYAPSADGQSFDIDPGATVTLNSSFAIPTVTSLDNLALVVYAQNDNSHEVLQAGQLTLYPNISLSQWFIFDLTGGNANMIPEPGETCDLWTTLINSPSGAAAEAVTATLTCNDPGITIIEGESDFGDIGPGENATNSADAFVFEVSSNLQPHLVTFTLTYEANGGSYLKTEDFEIMVGIPDILLVDDDTGNSYEDAYIACFDDLDLAYDVWNISNSGSPSAATLLGYDKVIWFTGRADHPLSDPEITAISGYLDGGGKLFISSENLSDDLSGNAFLADYMHVSHGEDYLNIDILNGVPDDPISDGMLVLMAGGAYAPDDQSVIIPDGEALPLFNYDNVTEDCGAIRYEGDYMLVFLAFPFECTAVSPAGYTARTDIMNGILNWFNGFVEVTPTPETGSNSPADYVISSVYPNPFNPQTSIRLNVRQTGWVEASVYNLLGERVETVHSGVMNSGSYVFTFGGADLTSGVYLLKVETPSGMMVNKMILMK